jgi:hypothetical protein
MSPDFRPALVRAEFLIFAPMATSAAAPYWPARAICPNDCYLRIPVGDRQLVEGWIVHPAPTLLPDVASRVDHSWPQVVGQRQITALMSAIASVLRSSSGPEG